MAGIETVSVVTGANSGLGLGIARRLVDQFLKDHGSSLSHTLKIIITTRSTAKAESAIAELKAHLSKSVASYIRHSTSLSPPPRQDEVEARFKFEYVLMDLCSLYSVTAASKQFLSRYTHIDQFFCNAGLSGVIGIDWAMAARRVPIKFVEELNYGSFRIQSVGEMTSGHSKVTKDVKGTAVEAGEEVKEIIDGEEKAAIDDSELGAIFCANVFGHYYLLHEIMPLLHSSVDRRRSRIVWIGSITSKTNSPFDVEDLQGLRSKLCYDSSKRLTEVLVQGSRLPLEAVDGYNAIEPASRIHMQKQGEKEEDENVNGKTVPPVHLIAHPGVINSTFVSLHPIMGMLWLLAMYIARFLGSKWQNIAPYNGAAAPVYVATTEDLDALVGTKFGSSCNRWGKVKVVETPITDGWQEIAGRCWDEMEKLRKRWKIRVEN